MPGYRLYRPLYRPAVLAGAAGVEQVSGEASGSHVVPAGIHKIKHVIIVMQENPVVRHLLRHTCPGADGIPMANGTPIVCVPNPADWLPGAGRRAVAADDLAAGAFDLAGAVRVHGQRPAQLVQQHVVMPPAVVLEVRQAGPAAVGPVHHMVRLAPGRGLVAAARMLAGLVPQCH